MPYSATTAAARWTALGLIALASQAGTLSLALRRTGETDQVQTRDPDFRGGANDVSLTEARENYRRIGVSDPQWATYARQPRPEELEAAVSRLPRPKR